MATDILEFTLKPKFRKTCLKFLTGKVCLRKMGKIMLKGVNTGSM